MDTVTLSLTIIGSASFGAIVGKFLDAFLLSRVNYNFERKKLLRQNRIDAFTVLTEELLSLGINKDPFKNPWKFRAVCSKAILLIEDIELRKEINDFLYDVCLIGNGLSEIKTTLPDDFKIRLRNGKEASIKHVQIGFEVEVMEKRALEIVNKLSKIINSK